MKALKTIKVELVKNLINEAIANTPIYVDEGKAKRQALAAVLGKILMATGNYQGFNYIAWANEGGYDRWKADGSKPEEKAKYLGDLTRVFFY